MIDNIEYNVSTAKKFAEEAAINVKKTLETKKKTTKVKNEIKIKKKNFFIISFVFF